MKHNPENRDSREKKILLVDDEPVNIKIMSQILRDRYRLMVATGGHEALKCATSAQPPDLILLDLVMPGMDGIEVCRQLKASESTKDIPIIVVTGKAEQDEITEAIEAGAADCVRKPVIPEILKLRVANQLALKRCKTDHGQDIVAAALQQEKEANLALKNALRRAEEELESSRQYRHMFIAEMHHEIKTHLTTIVGMAGLAMRQELLPVVRDYIATIQNATDTLVELINDIVDLSLLESGELETEEQEFSPALLINDVCDACGELALKKEVELVVDISPEMPAMLSGSAARLRQLLTHLVHFNIKWLGGKEILMKADGYFTDFGRFMIECSICCCDSSLTDREARGLFTYVDPLKHTRDRRSVGTGLGLPICRRIVENMSGRISVTTSADSGVTFTCTIPFHCRERDPVPAACDTELMKGLKVLVADDSKLALQVTGNLLRRLGCTVNTVQAWEEVLDCFSNIDSQEGQRWDLLILDWKMPGMDGLEITKRLRSQGVTIPIIVTGMPALLMMSMVHEAGTDSSSGIGIATDFIMKPVKREALLEKIHNLLSPKPIQVDTDQTASEDQDYRQLSGIRVLLVEDNAINRQIARQLLEMAGMEVTGVGSGRSAVEAASRNQFDVILMDIELPDINGVEAAIHIRNIPAYSRIPVIALTAHSWSSHRKAYQEAGMKFCIEKPIDPDELYATLRKAVSNG